MQRYSYPLKNLIMIMKMSIEGDVDVVAADDDDNNNNNK